jgi:hypothetical protein
MTYHHAKLSHVARSFGELPVLHGEETKIKVFKITKQVRKPT